MDDDQLRRRLQAADPARDDAPAASWLEDLVEATMNDDQQHQPARRRVWIPAAAAAAVLAIGGGVYAVNSGNDRDDDGAGKKHVVLALDLPAPDAMGMCIEFSPDALRPMEVALSGEVYAVEGEEVRIAPDRWYKGGGGANDVRLTAGSEAVLLEGGITFTEGERYLIAAYDGVVATCGLSGEHTPEMAAAYDEAFGG